IQVMQQILKDARIRDAADQIRNEVMHLGDDLGRLRERVLKLGKHFGDVNEDVRQILISSEKIEKRAGRIEELDFSKEPPPDGRRLVRGGDLLPLQRRLRGGEWEVSSPPRLGGGRSHREAMRGGAILASDFAAGAPTPALPRLRGREKKD